MQQLFEQTRFVLGDVEMVAGLGKLPVLRVFDERVMSFLASLSTLLLHDPRVKAEKLEDIVGYAYWIRKASLARMKQNYGEIATCKIGRGVCFHIAPSNVPINFAVSFTAALLAGNASIVRISDKEFEQVEIIVEAIERLFKQEYEDIRPYLTLIRYGHDQRITAYFSSICDVRVIWGGNETIRTIRKAELPARAFDLTFSDRYSLAIMDAKAVINADIDRLAKDFYNDTYYIDQNACYSSRIVIWRGNENDVSTAKTQFWSALSSVLDRMYTQKEIHTIDKLNALCLAAANIDGARLSSKSDIRLMRIEMGILSANCMEFRSAGGYFYEYRAETLDELPQLLTKECQTVCYFGVAREEILSMVLHYGVRGVDRIVPVGKAMEANVIWDGVNLVEAMSRYIM